MPTFCVFCVYAFVFEDLSAEFRVKILSMEHFIIFITLTSEYECKKVRVALNDISFLIPKNKRFPFLIKKKMFINTLIFYFNLSFGIEVSGVETLTVLVMSA